MLRVFEEMLKDADPVCFIVDALVECNEGLEHFIKLTAASLYFSTKVRWLISSRREVNPLKQTENQMENNRSKKI